MKILRSLTFLALMLFALSACSSLNIGSSTIIDKQHFEASTKEMSKECEAWDAQGTCTHWGEPKKQDSPECWGIQIESKEPSADKGRIVDYACVSKEEYDSLNIGDSWKKN